MIKQSLRTLVETHRKQSDLFFRFVYSQMYGSRDYWEIITELRLLDLRTFALNSGYNAWRISATNTNDEDIKTKSIVKARGRDETETETEKTKNKLTRINDFSLMKTDREIEKIQEQINIEAVESSITISGERQTERQTADKDGVAQFERSSGSFYRRMTLPADANVDNIAAKYEGGVLEVTIPKTAPSKTEKKKIQVQ